MSGKTVTDARETDARLARGDSGDARITNPRGDQGRATYTHAGGTFSGTGERVTREKWRRSIAS